MNAGALSFSQLLWREQCHSEFPVTDGDVCDACAGLDTELVPAVDVVSANFTDWDRLSRDKRGLCRACVWSLREGALRTKPQVADRFGVHPNVGWGALAAVLGNPVTFDTAITVPFGGRKHLVPFARPGKLSTDWGLIPWTNLNVELLNAVTVLRACGMKEREIASGDSLPRLTDTSDHFEVFDAYGVVRSWRGTPAMPVALRVTRSTGAGARGKDE